MNISSLDKTAVLDALIDTLRKELDDATAASRDAADYATNEESRAESQWDTQGLEASYLAAGQAGQARKWAEALSLLKGSRAELLQPMTVVRPGALLECDLNGFQEFFFLAPAGGGIVVELVGVEVTVITPQSPVATQLVGKEAGAHFSLPSGAAASIKGIA